MAQVVGKVFKVDDKWNFRVSIDGGQSGKFERGPFENTKAATTELCNLLTKVDALYNSDTMKELMEQPVATAK